MVCHQRRLLPQLLQRGQEHNEVPRRIPCGRDLPLTGILLSALHIHQAGLLHDLLLARTLRYLVWAGVPERAETLCADQLQQEIRWSHMLPPLQCRWRLRQLNRHLQVDPRSLLLRP